MRGIIHPIARTAAMRIPHVPLGLFAALLLLTLQDCSGPMVTLSIPQSQVRQQMQSKFPLTKIYGGIGQITLLNPALHLQKGANRLSIALDAVISPLGLGAIKLARGNIIFSSSLAFNDSLVAIVLDEVRVDSLAIESEKMPDALRRGISDAVRTTLQQELEGSVFHKIDDNSLKAPLARVLVRSVSIQQDAIVIKLAI
jgi:hypothetical protein